MLSRSWPRVEGMSHLASVSRGVRTDREFLDHAARLALRGRGLVEPNPCVGCVIVKDGQVIGRGFHARFGGPHAEREALQDCARRGDSPRGATMYVTLEPCAHMGKQPPCTEAIFEQGIARVVFARHDPHKVSGRGAGILNAAGIECRESRASEAAIGVSEPFVRRVQTGLPWVIAKWAQTIDGRIATRTGESKWISNEFSRARVHALRSRVDCVLTGLGTVLADDPALTARNVSRVRRVARRVVLDTHLAIPEDRAILRSARDVPTIIACAKEMATAELMTERRQRLEALGARVMGVPTPLGGRVNLRLLLRALVEHLDATNVLVEAGPALLGSLFAEDLVDEAVVYVAPLLLGDQEAASAAIGRAVESLRDSRRFRLCRVKRLRDDLELTYRRVRAEG